MYSKGGLRRENDIWASDKMKDLSHTWPVSMSIFSRMSVKVSLDKNNGDPPSYLPPNNMIIFEENKYCSSLSIQEQNNMMLWELFTELFTINCMVGFMVSVSSGYSLINESVIQWLCNYYSTGHMVWLKLQMKKISI